MNINDFHWAAGRSNAVLLRNTAKQQGIVLDRELLEGVLHGGGSSQELFVWIVPAAMITSCKGYRISSKAFLRILPLAHNESSSTLLSLFLCPLLQRP